MQIVIDIPKEVYEEVQRKFLNTKVNRIDIIDKAIFSGAILPKGHGRLVDAGTIALIDEDFASKSDYVVAECAVKNAPTVLEAEGEDADD